MNKQISIIGLDRVGLSLGLAIKKNQSQVEVVGFDLNNEHLKTALNIKAVNRIDANLHSAVEKADIVLLNSLPLDVTDWMADICRSLKENAVLINIAPLHTQACAWAASNFPQKRSFINATLSINGSFLENEDYSADLFNNGLMVISTLPGTDEDAVQQVLDLAAQIGAFPMFTDPLEADGLLSQTDLFPRLVSLLYLQGISSQSGWSDAQKVTGPTFWQMSRLFRETSSGKAAAHEIFAHKGNVLHLLDMMRDQIDHLQDEIQTENEETLALSLQKTLDNHSQWMTRRKSGDWDAQASQPEVKPKGMWKKLLGIETPEKKK